MENTFIKNWGEKNDHMYVLTELNAMTKKHNEDVSEFIKRFNKLYNSLHAEIKPPFETTKVIIFRAFELDFGFTLR